VPRHYDGFDQIIFNIFGREKEFLIMPPFQIPSDIKSQNKLNNPDNTSKPSKSQRGMVSGWLPKHHYPDISHHDRNNPNSPNISTCDRSNTVRVRLQPGIIYVLLYTYLYILRHTLNSPDLDVY